MLGRDHRSAACVRAEPTREANLKSRQRFQLGRNFEEVMMPKNGPAHGRPVLLIRSSLEGRDVRRLQALGAAGNFEFNRLAVVQGLVTVRLNGREVNENILARLALNESESLAGVKPLYSSLFSQLLFSFLLLSYLVSLLRL
jgi:hypothetical protein